MFWLFLYVYFIGTVNDIMFAISHEADLKNWRTHVSIAFWPITVPVAIVYSMFEKD